jgi:hypothetical protein
MNLTVCSAVYGNFFERFGHHFISMLEGANCEQAILVSDKQVPVPSFIKLVVRDFVNLADLLNAVPDVLETDWALYMGFDDRVVPTGLSEIHSEADIYGWPHIMTGLRSGLSGYSGDYENTWKLGHNPMAGGFAYRKELLQDIPFRDYIYLDWIHFCETSYFGKTFEFSPQSRTEWVRREDSLALGANREAHAEVYEFQYKLSQGTIQKGVAE